jgi:Fuc2NAc and GlcNAc transferase
MLLLFALGLFLTSMLLVGLYVKYAMQKGILDVSSDRSAHQGIIPRGAGIVFLALWLISALIGYQTQIFSAKVLLLCLPTTALISLVGFWDDNKGLTVSKRLFIQFILALLFMSLLIFLEDQQILQNFLDENGIFFGILLGLAGLLSIIWSVNLFNFMDGLDGIASIEAFFVLGIGGFFCYQHGASELALLAFLMLAAVAGFLVWNWPRAIVFMGDVGSYCLGGLISLLAIIGYWVYQIPFTLWLILYGLFWFDATLTLIRRIIFKRNITDSHREHAYQRLHQVGFTQQQLLLGVIAINTILSSLACYANYKPEYLGICFIISIILLSLITYWIEKQKPLSRNS